MPFAEVRGNRTYYRQSGDGPNLVLIHGVTGNTAGWYLSGLVSLTAPFFRVTAYDLRGHGTSDVPRNGYTSDELAFDALELMSQLEIDDAILLGHSFGAVVAAHVATLAPEKARGLILSEVNFPGLESVQPQTNEWPGWENYKRCAAERGVQLSENLLDLEHILNEFDRLSPTEQKEIERIMGTGALTRLQRLIPTTCGRDVGLAAGLDEDAILQLTLPVECVYGELSPFLATRDYLVEHLAQCSTRTVPMVEHFAFDEDPESFHQAIAESLCALAGLELSAFGTIKKGELLNRSKTVMSPRGER